MGSKNKKINIQKRTEQMIGDDHKATRSIIENAPFGIYVVTDKGNIDYVNPAMLEISGETYEKFLHLNIFDLSIFKEIGLTDKIKAGLKGEHFKINSVEYTSHCSQKTAIVNFIGIPLKGAETRKVLIVTEDITEQKKVEDDLRKANEKLKGLNQLKSDFISTVSHEIRTPLTSIRESISQMLEGVTGEINEAQKDFLSIALESIDSLWGVATGLLDVSKIEAGRIELEKKLTNICEIVKNTAQGFQNLFKNKRIVLSCIMPREGVSVFVDAEKIMQAVSNLISNAYKFTRKGGRVTISVKNKKKEVEVAVKDTGIGIAKANIPRLFDKFRQFGQTVDVAEKGTGLGLVISKGLIEMHGGKIWVESELDKGSRFVFILPKVRSGVIFKEYLRRGMKEAVDKESVLSLVVLRIENYNKLDRILSNIRSKDILRNMEKKVKEVLRKNEDIFLINDTGECVVLLIDTGREGTIIIRNRIIKVVKKYMDDFRKKHKIELRINSSMATYPEESGTTEELLLRARVNLDMSLKAENRQSLRMDYKIDVGFIEGNKKTVATQSVNISELGICISSSHYNKKGTKNELILEFPKRFGVIKVKAETKWIKKIERT
ncbi:MAG: ATP-binding protein, partial [Candidatus Omnitrophota bacterium]|nr:ATP-binding protein [Candidatus Omnitrophota bacterium]